MSRAATAQVDAALDLDGDTCVRLDRQVAADGLDGVQRPTPKPASNSTSPLTVRASKRLMTAPSMLTSPDVVLALTSTGSAARTSMSPDTVTALILPPSGLMSISPETVLYDCSPDRKLLLMSALTVLTVDARRARDADLELHAVVRAEQVAEHRERAPLLDIDRQRAVALADGQGQPLGAATL